MNMLFWEWMKKKGYGFVINELSEPNQYYECGLKFVDDNYPLYLIPEQMLIGYMIEYIMEKEEHDFNFNISFKSHNGVLYETLKVYIENMKNFKKIDKVKIVAEKIQEEYPNSIVGYRYLDNMDMFEIWYNKEELNHNKKFNMFTGKLILEYLWENGIFNFFIDYKKEPKKTNPISNKN